jgi:peptidoglycan-associated lipoprotein
MLVFKHAKSVIVASVAAGLAMLVPVASAIMIPVATATVISAAIATMIPVATATPARAESKEQIAGEMLQDGFDALAGRNTSLAAQLFGQVIAEFPGTMEAARADRELSALTQTDAASGELPLPGESADPAALRMKFAVEAGDRVFFAENSAVIGGRARALLENQARWLQARQQLKITIIGRADDGGSEDDARGLSAKRAEAVRDKLVAGGVPASRILIDARGTRDPVATCHSALCQAQNRHAETSIGGGVVTGAGDTAIDATIQGANKGASKGTSNGRRGATIGGAGAGVTVSR